VILPLNLAAAVAASSKGDDLRPGLDPASVTPGTLGFIFTLLIVVAVIFLIRDMTKRIRRVRYNAMLQEDGGGTGTVTRATPDAGPAKEPGSVPMTAPDAGPAVGTDSGTGTAPGSAPARDAQ
jgi:hypothetical protein